MKINKKFISLLNIVCLILIFACSEESTAEYKNLLISTDKTEYSIEDTISLSIKNISDATIQFMICNGKEMVFMEKEENGWEPVFPEEECIGFGTFCCNDLLSQDEWTFNYYSRYLLPGNYRFRINGVFNELHNGFEYPVLSNSFEIR